MILYNQKIEIKIRKEIEELLFKPTNASMEDMDKFEEKETMRKKQLAKNTWYNWLINFILELIKKRWVMLKIKLSIFKRNATRDYNKPTRVTNVYGGVKKPRKRLGSNIINDVRRCTQRQNNPRHNKPF